MELNHDVRRPKQTTVKSKLYSLFKMFPERVGTPTSMECSEMEQLEGAAYQRESTIEV